MKRKIWVIGTAGVLLFVLLFVLLHLAVTSVKQEVVGWFESIEDPTERGLAYVATAICAHAAVLAIQRFSHGEIKLKTKTKTKLNK